MPYCGFVLRDCIRMPPARDIFPVKTSHAVRSTVYQCEYLLPPILKKSPHGSESILFITQWPGTPEIYSGPWSRHRPRWGVPRGAGFSWADTLCEKMGNPRPSMAVYFKLYPPAPSSNPQTKASQAYHAVNPGEANNLLH